jgi:hypothetical protein
MSNAIFKKLDEVFGSARFASLLGELTPLELHNYMQDSAHDVTPYVWSYHVSWGFEAYWAWESTLTDEEKRDIAAESNSPVDEMFDGIPENFDINAKLKDIPLWAPQDLCFLGSHL